MAGPRVIAGLAKGRRLLMVPGGKTRPVSDRAKESLFNIIGPSIIETRFLDLFGGTGSVGIEALSRGAAESVFVDLQQNAVDTIHANLEHTKLFEKAVIYRRDAFDFILTHSMRPTPAVQVLRVSVTRAAVTDPKPPSVVSQIYVRNAALLPTNILLGASRDSR